MFFNLNYKRDDSHRFPGGGVLLNKATQVSLVIGWFLTVTEPQSQLTRTRHQSKLSLFSLERNKIIARMTRTQIYVQKAIYRHERQAS